MSEIDTCEAIKEATPVKSSLMAEKSINFDIILPKFFCHWFTLTGSRWSRFLLKLVRVY
ncbi:MAG: hypothetical protein ACKVIK_02940 [Rhodospirillales bacterium]|jgi:hypothetical protein